MTDTRQIPRVTVTARLLLTLLAVFLFAGPAAAQREDPLAGLDRDQRRQFSAYTRLFCAQFFRYGEDRFVILPNHYREREASTGLTYDQAEEELTEVRLIRQGQFTKEERIRPNPGEVVAAALIIPAIDVGHYGYVSSVKVKEVLGPQEMIVQDIVLIHRDQVGDSGNTLRKRLLDRQQLYVDKTYRLLGFDTADLRPGLVYNGPEEKGIHLAVISTDPRHNFVMVNYDDLDRVRTSEFPEVLSYVHLTPMQFIDLVRANREQDLTGGDKNSLITIYRRFYNRYRPDRVSEGPAVRPQQPAEPEPVRPAQAGQPGEGEEAPAAQQPRRDDPEFIDAPPPKEDEDDWEYDEQDDRSPREPGFFGIPF